MAFWFPDDSPKSFVGGRGELRCGHLGYDGKGLRWIIDAVRFSVLGADGGSSVTLGQPVEELLPKRTVVRPVYKTARPVRGKI